MGSSSAPLRIEIDSGGVCFSSVMTAIYSVSLAAVTWRHEMWRDELQAWLIARDSLSISDLFHNLHYEGHPALWYLLLYLPAHLSWNPVSMQVINFLLAVINAWLILSARELPWYFRTLLVFGFFSFFMYGVAARSYMLSLVLLSAASRCLLGRSKHPILALAFLALAINTHVFAIPLVAILYLSLFCFGTGNSWKDLVTPFRKAKFWATSLILLLSVAVAYLTVRPPPDLRSAYTDGSNVSFLNSFLSSTGGSWVAFVPIPRSYMPKRWVNLFAPDHPTLLAALISIILLLLLTASFRSARSRFIFLGSAILHLIAFAITVRSPQPWHYGYMFVAFMLALLCDSYSETSNEAKAWLPRRFSVALILTILVFQSIAGLGVSAKDLSGPFSEAKETSEWLQRSGYSGNPLIIDPDTVGPALLGYMERQSAYYPACGCFGSFVKFKADWNSSREISAQDLNSIYKSSKLPAVFVTDKPLDQGRLEYLRLRPLHLFDRHTIFSNENYFLYLQVL